MNSISYTGRDYEDIRQSLIDLVPQLTENWRDFNESDLGVTIIELISAAQDMQNFYLDNQTFETYLDKAMQDKNIRSILRAMNYRIPLPVSARGTATIEFMGELPEYISFPKYTVFKSAYNSDLQYISTDRITAAAGATSVDIPIIEGELKALKFTKSMLAKNLSPASNDVSRRIYLNDNFVADHSVVITQEGYIWEECDDALLKYMGGRYYSVHKDSNGNVYVLMSVNFMDLLPADEEEEVTISYIRTKGTEGLINAYQITSVEVDDHLNQYITNVYNREATYGATNEPNLQAAKLLAREHAQTLGRYITIDDYANGVATQPSIMYSRAYDWKTSHLVNRPFTVFVWAVNQQGENLGLEEQKDLLNKFKDKGISAVTVEYQETEFVYFDVVVNVTLRPVTESEKSNILGTIEKYIRDTLAPKNIDYGGRLSISLLTSSIYTLSPYLKSVVVASPEGDVESSEIQLLRLNNVTVTAED